MKNTIFILSVLVLAATSSKLNAQTIFMVDNFSDKYFGKVYVSDTAEVFSQGWAAIFDKKTKQQLVKVGADELSVGLREGKMLANIKELPYGEQSVIMREDYNFDGKKDFALMDGHNSCYDGPSFQIYLATDNGFKHSKEFTDLAQSYCGMFNVDYDKKQIHTMTKSGCCWHQYSTFVVENNRPAAIKIVEEGLHEISAMWHNVETNRINGKMVTTEYDVFNDDDESRAFYSFEFSSKKKMRLLNWNDSLLYIFADKDGKCRIVYVEQTVSLLEKR